MSRQLTALEKYRITGTHDVREQLDVFERLDIPVTTRLSIGSKIIECVAYTEAVRSCFSQAQWAEIQDENIGTDDQLETPFRSSTEQDGSDAVVA